MKHPAICDTETLATEIKSCHISILSVISAINRSGAVYRTATTRFTLFLGIAISGGISFAHPSSADMQTVRTEQNGFVYHRLANCDHERGIATGVYNFRAKRPFLLELTDVCFDRTSGRLWASEPAEGFVLVSRQDTTEWYEVVSTDRKPSARSKVNAGRYDQGDGHLNGWVNFGFNPRRPSPTQYDNAVQHEAEVQLHGYLYNQPSPIGEDANGDFFGYVVGNDFWAREKEIALKERRDREVPFFSDEGSLEFSGNSGTANFKPSSVSTDKGGGELELQVSETGEITGSGQFWLQNGRLAGASPHDWKTAKLSVRTLAGQFVGDTGEQFVIQMLADGEIIDHDGFENPAMASFTITGYSQRILSIPGDPEVQQ